VSILSLTAPVRLQRKRRGHFFVQGEFCRASHKAFGFRGITAIAKTVAELTCGQDSTIRQQMIEQLMQEIMNYDAEFRREDAGHAISSGARH
jgi:hypothetical protein